MKRVVLGYVSLQLLVSGVPTRAADTDAQAVLRTHGVKINVDDMDKALVFYRDKLGFEPESLEAYPREVFLKTNERIKLSLRKVRMLRPHGPNDTRVSFTLQVNDLDEAIAAMRARGVEFAETEKRKEGVGFAISVRDPFGARVSLMHQTIVKVERFDEPKIYNFGFYVPDMDTARSFYAQKLGFIVRSEKYLPLDLPLGHADGTFGFMLHYRPDGVQAVKSAYPDAWPWHTIVFETANLKTALAALKKSGVRILGGTGVVVFEDPFGNVSELVEATATAGREP